MRVEIYARLQLLDQQLSTLWETRRSVAEQLGEGELLQELAERRRERSTQLKRARERASDLQWELEETEVRVRELTAQNEEGPTDPLVARELAMLRDRCSQLEEQALLQMEQVDQVARETAEMDSAWEERRASWAVQEPMLRSEWERLTSAIEALQHRRDVLAATLPTAALTLYDDLQRRHRGTAIASIRNRQCGVCRARLSGAVFDLLAGADPLVRCPRCGRVLARPSMIDDSSTNVPDVEHLDEST